MTLDHAKLGATNAEVAFAITMTRFFRCIATIITSSKNYIIVCSESFEGLKTTRPTDGDMGSSQTFPFAAAVALSFVEILHGEEWSAFAR